MKRRPSSFSAPPGTLGVFPCVEGLDREHCEFFDLANDPLEEYPLDKPMACTDYTSGTLTPAQHEWHFCRLSEVVATQSFF